MSVQELSALVSRLEAVAAKLEGAAGGAAAAAQPAEDTAAFVQAFDALRQGSLSKFLSLSKAMGGEVASMAAEIDGAFDLQREFLVVASKSKQPDQATLQNLLKPMSSKMEQVQDMAQKSRDRDMLNHINVLKETVPALGWVAVTPTPGPFVKDMQEAAMFYANRVLKDEKNKDANKEWVSAWRAMLPDLAAYIKEYHTTGVSWNPRGADATTPAPAAAAPPPPPPAGGPPPPPPPPALDTAEAAGDSKSALFADLNRGGAVTSGLKKVTDDMKTHKNPSLREGPAPFKKPPVGAKPATTPKPGAKTAAAKPADKPPVLELQGKRWMVEHHRNNNNLTIENTELKQTVYIFKCENSTVQVKGKVNSVVMDNCKKTAVVFQDVISGVEFVNCQSVKAQAMGRCPTVSIDKTDGCMVYLSKEAMDAEIVTAKSSEMNVLFPNADGDYTEHPIPEQFKSRFNAGKGNLETSVTEISG